MTRIEKKVNELLENFGIVNPPVPVEKIIRELGVKITFEPFQGSDDISGILYRDAQKAVIGINSEHPITRQRFSMAHELGHFILHRKQLFVDKMVRVNFRDPKSSLAIDSDEIQANAFAAELLMPNEFVKNEIRSLVLSNRYNRRTYLKEELIDELAHAFDVSRQAMEYRLNNLGVLLTE